MKNIVNLLSELERQVELQELRKLNLSDEEIDGYMEFYIESWFEYNTVTYDN